MRGRVNVIAFIAVFVAQAEPAGAQGLAERLACNARTVCDSLGSCTATSDAMEFEFKAVEIGVHGEGTYRLKREDVVSDAVLLGTLAHYIWQEGDELQTLLLDGENRFVLHSVNLADPPVSKTIFMTCEAA